ncbi:MAG: glycosyltransferase family 2 protein [Gemmataceae bacterium]|nr:glycosyltransferase family 2 protein [Gemmataceae bacterium]
MATAEAVFWGCAAVVLYAYLAYPLLVAVLARLFGKAVRRGPAGGLTVSFVVCARDEEQHIDKRLMELQAILEGTGVSGEIILVSDGSRDRTCQIARAYSRVRLVEIAQGIGKSAALSRGVEEARGEIVVFADVRQAWAPDALELLLENFADPQVGAVSGDLVVTSGAGAMEGVGLYWRFEKWLRGQESRLWSQVGVTGAISAVRRALFRPIPAGILLDDVHWPLEVAMQGYRVVHDSRALAYDRLPARAGDEFRRKVRTLSGNFQLAARLPSALLPWRNPVWLQWVSRKLARLVVPWAMLGLLSTNALMLESPFYLGLFAAQLLGVGLGLVGLATGKGGRLASAAASFLVLNAAAWVAFWVWVTGRARSAWRKVDYAAPRPQPQPGQHADAVVLPKIPTGAFREEP